MNRIVLDASPIVAFFQAEPGTEKVKELIKQAVLDELELLLTVVNWGEVYYSTWRVRGRDGAEKVSADIGRLPIKILDADLELATIAAKFRAQYKLPYADCFAAALAQQRGASVLTGDKDFERVEEAVSVLWLSDL